MLNLLAAPPTLADALPLPTRTVLLAHAAAVHDICKLGRLLGGFPVP